jgi:LysM repeat protein
VASENTKPPAAENPYTQDHMVVKGDTLSRIPEQYYGDAALCPKIFEANRDILQDPNKIKPAKYTPEALQPVESQIAELKASLARGDYKAVTATAPKRDFRHQYGQGAVHQGQRRRSHALARDVERLKQTVRVMAPDHDLWMRVLT